MKAGIIINTALGVLAAVGATYLISPELIENVFIAGSDSDKDEQYVLPTASGVKGIIRGEEWTDCTKVREKVAAEIAKKTAGMKGEELKNFAQQAENRLLLAQWVVADAECRALEDVTKRKEELNQKLNETRKKLDELRDHTSEGVTLPPAVAWDLKKLAEQVAKLEKEAKSAFLLSESAADAVGSSLMEKLGNDSEWMEQVAFSGECIRPGTALSILKKIADLYPEVTTNRMVRDIATATALEYAKSNWNQQDAVERADFYISAWKNGRLNTLFDTIPMWQRRMVCGCKGDNAYGSLSSLKWALDNVHIPSDRYSGACWRCSYRLYNIYGDSIHGPQYYAPFESDLGDNRQAMTYLIGGVCGSLSHFGAFAALANGVPAMTAGEPGHCAYIVLVGDKWTPAYSLSWDRGLHWQVFRNVYSYSSLHAATELYSQEAKAVTAFSDALRVIAGMQADAGKLDEATNTFYQSVFEQPCNWMAWREWMEELSNNSAATPQDWEKLNDTICSRLVPVYPEMAFELMQKGVMDGMAKAMSNQPERLRSACLKFWQNIKVMGPDRWHIERLADRQLAALKLTPSTPAPFCNFYADILSSLLSNNQYAPAILGWGNQLMGKMSEEGKSQLMQSMISAIGKTSGMEPADRIKLLIPTILAAEKNRDMASFQAIASMIEKMGHKNPGINMPSISPFPGKLASEGGMVWTSSTSKWDNPHEHAGLLTPEGGTFHTGKDKDAYVTVELPRQVNVTGVVIVTSPGNLHRCHNMVVQVSENGKDWTSVKELGPCNQRVCRVDLGDKLPLAKYVRILRSGGPEFFHLNGIYVYGNQAA